MNRHIREIKKPNCKDRHAKEIAQDLILLAAVAVIILVVWATI